jgi:hypothetical protein
MADGDISKARELLTAPAAAPVSPWRALGAAAFAATAATMMAGIMVLGPGVRFDEPAAVQALLPNG